MKVIFVFKSSIKPRKFQLFYGFNILLSINIDFSAKEMWK